MTDEAARPRKHPAIKIIGLPVLSANRIRRENLSALEGPEGVCVHALEEMCVLIHAWIG